MGAVQTNTAEAALSVERMAASTLPYADFVHN